VGILFAEDFDIEVPFAGRDELAEELHVIPAQALVDVEAVRQAAFAEGHAEGQRAATASFDADATKRDETAMHLLRQVAAGLTEAGREGARVSEMAAICVARVILGTLEALLPALCERHGAPEVAAIARVLLPALAHVPYVHVRAHPSAAALLQIELTRLDAELRSHIVLAPNETMTHGDMRMTWQDGSASRDATNIRQVVSDALQLFGLFDVTEETAATRNDGAPTAHDDGQPPQQPSSRDSQ
jgi:hypothetical protein